VGSGVYEALAQALDRLPNGFPRTGSGVEIEILKEIFTPEEADLAARLSELAETPQEVAARLTLDPEEVGGRLRSMAERGLIWAGRFGGRRGFRLAPFIVGFYEAQRETMSHRLAHLVEEYADSPEGMRTLMTVTPALHRVMPAHGAVKSEWVLPYDDVKGLLLEAKSFRLIDCICRHQQDLLGRRKCAFPVRACMVFYFTERPPGPDSVSREEALATLDMTEKVGLVHTVSNVVKGLYYICNCCGCCCAILRGVTQHGIKQSVACANYFATVDPGLCSGCADCQGRCQVGAIAVAGDSAVVDRSKCIGCGLCVTGCPTGAAELKLKPEDEIITPPEDFAAWEILRRANRGRQKTGQV
jgi:ferredoxin